MRQDDYMLVLIEGLQLVISQSHDLQLYAASDEGCIWRTENVA